MASTPSRVQVAIHRLAEYTGKVTQDTGSLREPTYLILVALADRSLHGHAIAKEVAQLSTGRVKLRPGTLYGALDRLSESGLVEVEGEEVVDGRFRRYYRLSAGGVELLRRETERLAANAANARRRLARRVEGTPA